MDPLNPFANAWDDDNKAPQNDNNDAAWKPAADTSVIGDHDKALPSWSQPAASTYDQDTSHNRANTYAPESSAWQPASPVWQASSLPVFDKEESDHRQLDEEAIPLPSPTRLTSVTEPATEDNDDWGQMALPKSRWEEELHKPPVWEPEAKEEPEIPPIELAPSTPSIDASEEWPKPDLGNEDDPWGAKAHTSTSNKHGDREEELATAYNGEKGEDKPVIDSRYHGGTPPESPSSSSFAERDFAPVKSSDIEKRKAAKDALQASRSSNTSAEDEDALRVLAELGVSVRNLDQEETAAKASAPSASRWSLFGARKAITPTAAQLESGRASIEAGAGQAAAKVSASMDVIREKAASVSLPRLSSSSSAAAASPADPSSRTATPPLTPGEGSNAPTFAQKESKWFRFGAKKPAVISPTTSEARPASAGSNNAPSAFSSTTTAAPATKAPIDILDDFGQLENFDSRLSAPTGPSTALSKTSGQTSRYDASSSLSSYHRDDLVADKPSWSFWSGRAPSASHSALGKNGIVEHANDGEAELDNIFEAFEAAPKKTTSDSAKKVFDGPSRQTRQVAPDLVGLDDPYSVLGVGSSRTSPSKRASGAKDLDPLDPLSAFVSSPPTKPVSRIPTGPISALAPPQLSSSTSRSQSANAIVKPLAPPPRLAPPPPSAGLRRTPSPSSLLDDFGDFAVSPTASAAQSSSSTPQPVTQVPPIGKPNDDFGDFEAFAMSASNIPSATPAVTASPKKAAGPMKLAPQKSSATSGPGVSLTQQDLSFFDSL